MQRVYWTLDLLEAHIVADFLCAQGIDARVFDAGFVRQDWLAAIAYGGYRVVTPDDEAIAAKKLIVGLRANEFALAEEDVEERACPRCGARNSVEDPRFRRAASALILFFKIPVNFFKWRYRCNVCGAHFKSLPEQPFAELSRQADAAGSDA